MASIYESGIKTILRAAGLDAEIGYSFGDRSEHVTVKSANLIPSSEDQRGLKFLLRTVGVARKEMKLALACVERGGLNIKDGRAYLDTEDGESAEQAASIEAAFKGWIEDLCNVVREAGAAYCQASYTGDEPVLKYRHGSLRCEVLLIDDDIDEDAEGLDAAHTLLSANEMKWPIRGILRARVLQIPEDADDEDEEEIGEAALGIGLYERGSNELANVARDVLRDALFSARQALKRVREKPVVVRTHAETRDAGGPVRVSLRSDSFMRLVKRMKGWDIEEATLSALAATGDGFYELTGEVISRQAKNKRESVHLPRWDAALDFQKGAVRDYTERGWIPYSDYRAKDEFVADVSKRVSDAARRNAESVFGKQSRGAGSAAALFG